MGLFERFLTVWVGLGMLAGVGGEYLNEPVIIGQFFQPGLTGFEAFAG